MQAQKASRWQHQWRSHLNSSLTTASLRENKLDVMMLHLPRHALSQTDKLDAMMLRLDATLVMLSAPAEDAQPPAPPQGLPKPPSRAAAPAGAGEGAAGEGSGAQSGQVADASGLEGLDPALHPVEVIPNAAEGFEAPMRGDPDAAASWLTFPRTFLHAVSAWNASEDVSWAVVAYSSPAVRAMSPCCCLRQLLLWTAVALDRCCPCGPASASIIAIPRLRRSPSSICWTEIGGRHVGRRWWRRQNGWGVPGAAAERGAAGEWKRWETSA